MISFTIPSKIKDFFVLSYIRPIPEARIAPMVSTIKSPMVSNNPFFCMLIPKNWSIENSNISQTAPIAIANENEKIAIAIGFASTS